MLKKIINKFLGALGVAAFVAVLMFADYGLETQCPGTAINAPVFRCGK